MAQIYQGIIRVYKNKDTSKLVLKLLTAVPILYGLVWKLSRKKMIVILNI